ncbi:hypothetical protein B0H11DRAFT_1944223 [Mycena galericulata]|nr:hypothetical protein B0H11DRAFT_1944223 [Mycena galericulata]
MLRQRVPKTERQVCVSEEKGGQKILQTRNSHQKWGIRGRAFENQVVDFSFNPNQFRFIRKSNTSTPDSEDKLIYSIGLIASVFRTRSSGLARPDTRDAGRIIGAYTKTDGPLWWLHGKRYEIHESANFLASRLPGIRKCHLRPEDLDNVAKYWKKRTHLSHFQTRDFIVVALAVRDFTEVAVQDTGLACACRDLALRDRVARFEFAI